MKKRSLLAVAALATCTAGAAMAADLPLRSPPPAPFVPPPLFTWTGFYAGINAGVSFENRAGLATPTGFTPGVIPGGPAVGTFGSFRGADSGVGFVGGGQVGYNVQSGMFVYGIEADIDYFGQGGGGTRTFDISPTFGAGSILALTRRNDDGYLGTVRGRLGLAAFDRTLLYVTGGLAYGDYGTSYGLAHFVDTAGVGTTRDFTGGNTGTRIGYALGAGVEYALTQTISAKAEYLYTDLGSRNYTLSNPGVSPAAVINVKSEGSSQLARLGLNYKF